MSGGDAGNLSIDDAILDYLSKKSIVDQTEKLALARISGKMEISSQQAEISINRLCTKNLVRKVYFQGKVGFELTPRGKSSLEVIAKAETARITSKLQESIHNERKVKLRSSSVNKLNSIALEWQNIQIPDRKLIDQSEKEVTEFLASTKEIAAKQPLCYKDPQNYDQEFSQYKPQIEKLIGQNSILTRVEIDFVKIKNYQVSVSADTENICRAIKKYDLIAEASMQVSELKVSLSKLKSIQSQLEGFDRDQLCRFEELKAQLGDNSRLLEALKKPTHEFAPVKRESLADKGTMYPDPECPIKYSPKKNEYPSVEKCGRCGTKRKATPVNIG